MTVMGGSFQFLPNGLPENPATRSKWWSLELPAGQQVLVAAEMFSELQEIVRQELEHSERIDKAEPR